MEICQKYKEVIENIYRALLDEIPQIKNHSEANLKYHLRKKLEEISEEIKVERPIFTEEFRIDILIGDIVVEVKRVGELSNQKKLNKYKDDVKEKYMKKYFAPFGILTDLKKIYFFELEDNQTIKEIKRDTDEFTYENFCFLLEILFGERKKFISEISLLKDFGGVKENKLILNLLKKLFSLLETSQNKKTKMIFLEWQKLFKLAETTHREYLEDRRKSLEGYFEKEINEENEYRCIFVMHTLLSLIVKLLTYSFLAHLNNWKFIQEESIKELKKFFERLEKGEIFREMGVINMCQNDFFSWYLSENWDKELFQLLFSLKNRASLYRHMNIEPLMFKDALYFKDALQKLYENFIPREIRHSFGEYYTPLPVCELMIEKAKNFLTDKIHYRAIDPTCGSGTFLISLLKDKILNTKNEGYPIKKIISEVVGIDLNPIAVLMAKFNYLLTVYPLLKKTEENITNIEIPVYLGDSSYMPIEKNIENVKCLTYTYYFPKDLKITFPSIVFPLDFVRSDNFLLTLIKIEEMITRKESSKSICEYLFTSIGEKSLNKKIKQELEKLIKKLINYQEAKLNTIWLFIFMNYLKPFALQKFDLIIGNPPWVRWSVLPYDYKEKIKKSLREKGLFSEDRTYGGVDLNICALIAYRVVENLSNDEGLLAFLFPQGVLVNKSYQGFRNFLFGNKKGFPVLILKPTKSFFGEEPIILFLKIKQSK